ncbi:hypothetical protein LI90_3290 [Carbonactinospora thermoautotrophica]|uniref:2Fe-2S ferredoxin-type domain-containing protein n=3 Tax=Carbonactinospora thermoautotrophica TaxID=1469144 RepID=A0A132MWP9_9ACTN|nr:hypothetical protein LI90_3290 [Carbonactinospora thermoautotrophica]
MNDMTSPDPTPGVGQPSGAGTPPVLPPAQHVSGLPGDGAPASAGDPGVPPAGAAPGVEAASSGWGPAYVPGGEAPSGAAGTGLPHPDGPTGAGVLPSASYPGAGSTAPDPGDPAFPPYGPTWSDPGAAGDPAWWPGQPAPGEPAAQAVPGVPADPGVPGEPGRAGGPYATVAGHDAPGGQGFEPPGPGTPPGGATARDTTVAFAEAETPPTGVFVPPITPPTPSSPAGEEPRWSAGVNWPGNATAQGSPLEDIPGAPAAAVPPASSATGEPAAYAGPGGHREPANPPAAPLEDAVSAGWRPGPAEPGFQWRSELAGTLPPDARPAEAGGDAPAGVVPAQSVPEPTQPFPADPHHPAARYPGATVPPNAPVEQPAGLAATYQDPVGIPGAAPGTPGGATWAGPATGAEGGPGGTGTPRVPEPRRPEPGGHAEPGYPPPGGPGTPQVPRARSAAETDPRPPEQPGGPGEEPEPLPTVSYQLRINGDEYVVENAWLGESLLYVLRERLDLFGTKNACEHGQCGACSVLVDGMLVNSCLVLAVTAQKRAITTIEGVTPPEEGMSDIQDAFVRAGAVQCGFCTPGMVMAVHALLSRNPEPEEFEIREALAGNLCRCTGYARIFEAVRMVVRERAGEAEG